jgi:hypothetical protein
MRVVAFTFDFRTHHQILKRIKYQLGFKGFTDKASAPATLLTRLSKYGLNEKRSLAKFLEITGIDFANGLVHENGPNGWGWCKQGNTPRYTAEETRHSRPGAPPPQPPP